MCSPSVVLFFSLDRQRWSRCGMIASQSWCCWLPSHLKFLSIILLFCFVRINASFHPTHNH